MGAGREMRFAAAHGSSGGPQTAVQKTEFIARPAPPTMLIPGISVHVVLSCGGMQKTP